MRFRIKIHKEGRKIIIVNSILWVLVAFLFCYFGQNRTVNLIVCAGCLFFSCFMFRFFRVPHREPVIGKHLIVSPADGQVINIQEVTENEFFHSKCLRISIFMTVNNIHVTWSPVSGVCTYLAHHQGDYYIACHPKASEFNEHTTIGVHTDSGHDVMFRQIAGYVARRIVCYAHVGDRLEQAHQAGFIKFGSRLEVYLPLDTEVLVRTGDKVQGQISVLAKLN